MNLSRVALRSFLVVAALALALPAQADPKADILAAHAAMMAKGKFRTVNKVTSNGETSTSTNVVQWPDRYQIKTKDMEMIILPEGTWMNQGGQWMKMPMNMAGMVKQLTPGEAVFEVPGGLAVADEDEGRHGGSALLAG